MPQYISYKKDTKGVSLEGRDYYKLHTFFYTLHQEELLKWQSFSSNNIWVASQSENRFFHSWHESPCSVWCIFSLHFRCQRKTLGTFSITIFQKCYILMWAMHTWLERPVRWHLASHPIPQVLACVIVWLWDTYNIGNHDFLKKECSSNMLFPKFCSKI